MSIRARIGLGVGYDSFFRRSQWCVGREQFYEPSAHIKDAADTVLRKHLSKLHGGECRNPPLTISGLKINDPKFTI